MKPDQLDVVLRLFDDRRALIAAGKVQRWEVVKWVVTANVALAAAVIAVKQLHFLFFVFAVSISLMGCVLLWHYNMRITGVRASLRHIHARLTREVINTSLVSHSDFESVRPPEFDRQELYIFYSAVLLSVLPSLIAMLATNAKS